jgi:hypothetical protein
MLKSQCCRQSHQSGQFLSVIVSQFHGPFNFLRYTRRWLQLNDPKNNKTRVQYVNTLHVNTLDEDSGFKRKSRGGNRVRYIGTKAINIAQQYLNCTIVYVVATSAYRENYHYHLIFVYSSALFECVCLKP